MRRIQFSEDEVLQLKKERLEHEHPIVRRRMMALYLKALGYRHKDICNELDITHVCLYEYLDLYMNEGLDGLKRLGYHGRPNLLDEKRDIIIAYLETNPPGTLKEAQARIEEITGIKRSLPQIRAFLKKTASPEEGEANPRKGKHPQTGAVSL
jgi:transposase